MVIEKIILPGSGNPGFLTSLIEILIIEPALNLSALVELILTVKMFVFRGPLLILHYIFSDKSLLKQMPVLGTPTSLDT